MYYLKYFDTHKLKYILRNLGIHRTGIHEKFDPCSEKGKDEK